MYTFIMNDMYDLRKGIKAYYKGYEVPLSKVPAKDLAEL